MTHPLVAHVLVFGQKYYLMPKACIPIQIPNWESIFPFACPQLYDNGAKYV